MGLFDEGLPRPELTLADAARWAQEHYGLVGDLRELGSQQDRNVLVSSPRGQFLLKVSNPASSLAQVEAQNEAMRVVAAGGLGAPVPVSSLTGREVVEVAIGRVPHLVRLLTFVEGRPLIDAGRMSPAAVVQLGRLAGQVSRSLGALGHPGLDRDFQWDLRRGEEVVRSLLDHVQDPDRRTRVGQALADVSRRMAPLAEQLPQQALHADLTDDNVVAHRDVAGRVVLDGVIDFGDVSTGWRVAELAVACTAVFHHHPDDPFAVLPLIRAFHDRCPLTDAEVEALWPLIVLRGTVLVVSGEQQAAVDPTNAYAVSALEREWQLFSVPASVDPDLATAAVRAALGLPGKVPAVLENAGPILGGGVSPVVVDLGATSRALLDGAWLDDGPQQEGRVLDGAATESGRSVTAFAQARLTRCTTHSRVAPRNVALGVDLRAPGEQLLAPFSGTVDPLDGAVVLRGATHSLVVTGLSAVETGSLRAGSPLGGISHRVRVWLLSGSAEVVPPAFVRAEELAAWESRLLDPGPLLGLDSTRVPVPSPSEALTRRSNTYSGLQGHYYASPPQIERGWREHLIDTQGRHYVDMVNNVTVLGHGHPRVAQAAADQWRMLNTNSRFHYGGVADLSERLLATLPDSFDTVLLVNSGSEAVDLALRLTKAYTARDDVVCLSESYHGWTLASDAVSTSLSDNPIAGSTRSGWVHVTTTPNAYRGPHRGPGAGLAYAAEAVALLERLARDGNPAGTFIAEPRQGNAGAIEVPEGYLARVHDAVRAGGGVCISDEVQVGYGRQGDVFWGYEQHPGVVPDVITVAKAMGNGHPLGAVVTRREIAEALADQGTFFSSAGGSTVSCRVGVEVLDVISDEGLQANAAEVGTHLGARLEDLAKRHPMVGAVHGRGLYQGVELVRDGLTLEPATEETAAICDRMLELGVIVQPTGDRQNILKVKPPLCFTRESADFFVATLDEVLTDGW